MKVIDLRSDTVTRPTPPMLEAMVSAELGDDVLGDDPTVKRLEALAAQRLGKEAALFTASGTMSNLLALLAHCQRGDEAIVGHQAHLLHYEVGGAFALGGIGLRPISNDARGRLDLDELRDTIRGMDIHFPRTGLVCLENTHNLCGGSVQTEADTAAVAAVAREHGIPLHLDGARIFNAAVALGVEASRLARDADSVCFSLCKGLSCPIGSLLCGSVEFIERARRWRKMVGGGMRQVGIIAAAGIVALETMVDRLAEDHENARILGQGLSAIEGVRLEPPEVETNLVYFSLEGVDPQRFQQLLWDDGVLSLVEDGRIRMVTHYGIERGEIEQALERARRVAGRLA
ncbi:MAG: low-specificity L-threonine aldolase [Dehalococcoidia bacterium]